MPESLPSLSHPPRWGHTSPTGVHGVPHADQHDAGAVDFHRPEGSRGEVREGGDPDFPGPDHA